ncbi:MAG TPA: hypothetical protein VNA19_15635 [Pyrinomonadaceae bacterium]|jgi:hypothetical protein|nr:hypothetical protein [Pyrinomonadaceae bacterium]
MSTSQKPKVGEFYSREEISRMFRGSSWTYLPRYQGDVVSGCFRTDLNPKAPEEVLVGYGKLRISSAKRLVEQNTPIPVFLQRASKQWEFIGYYRGKKFSDSPSEVTPKARAANLDRKVAGVLYLEKAEDV